MSEDCFTAKVGFAYRKGWFWESGITNRLEISTKTSGGHAVLAELKFDRRDNCDFCVYENQEASNSKFECRGIAKTVGGFFSRKTHVEFTPAHGVHADLVLEWNAVGICSIECGGRSLNYWYFGSTHEVNFKCDALSVRLTFQMSRREGRLTVDRSALSIPFEYALVIGAIAWRIEQGRAY